MDRRFFAMNGRVAHSSLEGSVKADKFVDGEELRIVAPVADLRASPDGTRDKQMLRGQSFKVLENRDGWVFGFDVVDDYVGYLRQEVLTQLENPSHRVRTLATHAYTEPDFKSTELCLLSFFSEVHVRTSQGGFCETDAGWIPAGHLVPISWRTEDPATSAELFLGVPYLWGGNSVLGIDCSGLTQLALHSFGRAFPRDSDVQESFFDSASGDYQRGDLLFWKGHVAMVADKDTLIHANAHHMAVAYEGIAEAIRRIEDQGDGPVTSHKRPVVKGTP